MLITNILSPIFLSNPLYPNPILCILVQSVVSLFLGTSPILFILAQSYVLQSNPLYPSSILCILVKSSISQHNPLYPSPILCILVQSSVSQSNLLYPSLILCILVQYGEFSLILYSVFCIPGAINPLLSVLVLIYLY